MPLVLRVLRDARVNATADGHELELGLTGVKPVYLTRR